MKISRKLQIAASGVALLVGAMAPGIASAIGPNTYGVAVVNSGVATITMNNTSPATVATLTTTDAPVQGTWEMKNDTNWWGGTGDASTAYTPSNVYNQNGIGYSWYSTNSECANVTGTLVPGQLYECDTHPTITVSFNRTVTNPVISVADLAGGGSTASLWSDYALTTPGLTMTLLSHASNFEVHSDGTSFGVINPPGTGFTPGSGESAVNLLPSPTKPTEYGAGYGSVQINGSMSSFQLRVTLHYILFDSSQVTTPDTTNSGTPEGVSILMSVPGVNANPATHTIDTTKPYSGSAIIDGNTSGATYSVPTQPSCGNVEMAADGTYTFTANSTMSGDCTFTYQVCSTTDTTDCTTADITLSGTGLAFTGFRSSSTLLVASFFVVAGGAFMMAASRYRRRLRA